MVGKVSQALNTLTKNIMRCGATNERKERNKRNDV
jgi:hypothetical protein